MTSTSFNIPIAVITNGSLLNDSMVREELCLADWVSVKIDTADKRTWKTLNRPLAKLDFDHYKNGLLKFSQEFTPIPDLQAMPSMTL